MFLKYLDYEKERAGEVFAMARRRRVQTLRSKSKKRRGHSPGNKFLSFNLNQPVNKFISSDLKRLVSFRHPFGCVCELCAQ